jgi:seryl-tRNA synthetase
MQLSRLEAFRYSSNFPHLLGCVSCVDDDTDRRAVAASGMDGRSNWIDHVRPSGLALIPAGCFPVYDIAAARGAVPAAGVRFHIGCWCFRREPSDDPFRLQSFEMREHVFIGSGASAKATSAGWLFTAADFLDSLGLIAEAMPGADPFFGHEGDFLGALQRRESSKTELNVRVGSRSVACVSINYHKDRFARAAGLSMDDGALAHSCCMGFGLERLAAALVLRHGPVVSAWPSMTRESLRL